MLISLLRPIRHGTPTAKKQAETVVDDKLDEVRCTWKNSFVKLVVQTCDLIVFLSHEETYG